jgi:hypothetical protein
VFVVFVVVICGRIAFVMHERAEAAGQQTPGRMSAVLLEVIFVVGPAMFI